MTGGTPKANRCACDHNASVGIGIGFPPFFYAPREPEPTRTVPSRDSSAAMSALDQLTTRVTESLLALLSDVPTSELQKAADPAAAAQPIIRTAARKSAAVSGTLSIPPGPVGLLTIVPDLMVVWRIQQQMVADIAALHGRSAALDERTMTYCLFQHSSSQLVRDLVARAGPRHLVQRATAKMVRSVLKRIGVRLTRLLLGKSVARLIPLVGAAAVAGYAYHDTIKVAASAMELFRREIVFE